MLGIINFKQNKITSREPGVKSEGYYYEKNKIANCKKNKYNPSLFIFLKK